jgi:hypothetical protein
MGIMIHNYQPVKTPSGSPSRESDPMPPDQLLSMEVAKASGHAIATSIDSRYRNKGGGYPPGHENYAVQEGHRCRISIPHQGDVIVTIPRRACGSQVVYRQAIEFSA